MKQWLEMDNFLFQLINQRISSPFFDAFFPALTDLHRTLIFQIIIIPLLVYAVFSKYGKPGGWIFLGLGLSLAITEQLGQMAKSFWHRLRPFENLSLQTIQRSEAGSFSFPSNHAAHAFGVAFFLSAFFPKYRWFFFSYASMVAISRVYNGVHYPFDVFAGAVMGGACGWSLSYGTQKLMSHLTKKKRVQ